MEKKVNGAQREQGKAYTPGGAQGVHRNPRENADKKAKHEADEEGAGMKNFFMAHFQRLPCPPSSTPLVNNLHKVIYKS